MKRILRNEGLNEDQDDIFRPTNAIYRKKLKEVLHGREEVAFALNHIIDNHLDRLYADKIGSLFSFIVKTEYPL